MGKATAGSPFYRNSPLVNSDVLCTFIISHHQHSPTSGAVWYDAQVQDQTGPEELHNTQGRPAKLNVFSGKDQSVRQCRQIHKSVA